MFSLVIYDKIKNEVFMCRDRFGVKPFFYKKAAVPNEIDRAPAIPTLKVFFIFLTQD